MCETPCGFSIAVDNQQKGSLLLKELVFLDATNAFPTSGNSLCLSLEHTCKKKSQGRECLADHPAALKRAVACRASAAQHSNDGINRVWVLCSPMSVQYCTMTLGHRCKASTPRSVLFWSPICRCLALRMKHSALRLRRRNTANPVEHSAYTWAIRFKSAACSLQAFMFGWSST